MRILMVVSPFHPDRAGGASVFTDLASGLTERGHEVTVWCPHPYYPEWRDKSGWNAWHVAHDELGDVRIERHWLWIPSDPTSVVQRLLFEASFLLSIFRRGGWRRFDVVVPFVPLIGGALAAGLRCKMARVPVLMNVQDLPAEAAEAGGIAKGKVSSVLRFAQRITLSLADRIVTISPVMADRLALYGLKQPPVVVPNWLNATAAEAVNRVRPHDRVDNGSVRLLYAGNLGQKQGLGELVRRLAQTGHAFTFEIFGEGSARTKLERLLETLGDDRFSLGPFMTEEEFVRVSAACDWFVIPERDNRGASFLPSKLVPVISTGTPIMAITSRQSPLGVEVSEHDLGLVLDWDDLADQFREALPRHRTFVPACRRRARRYHRTTCIDELEGILETLCEGP